MNIMERKAQKQMSENMSINFNKGGRMARTQSAAVEPYTGSVDALFNEVSKYPTLNAEQEHELAVKAKAGDAKARERLICCNIKLAINYAKQWATNQLEQKELIGPAMEGLIKAVDKFDPDCGKRFAAYAPWWIKERIQNYCECMETVIKLTHRQRDILTKLNKARKEMSQELGSEVKDNELVQEMAKVLSKNPIELHALLDLQNHISFDSKPCIFDGDSTSVEDRYNESDDDEFDINIVDDFSEENRVRTILLDAIDRLPEKQRQVIEMLYGMGEYENPMKVNDIADELSVTTETVRNRKKVALAFIKDYMQPRMAA